MSSRLSEDAKGKASSQKGRIPVRSTAAAGEEGTTARTTTSSSTSSSTSETAERLLDLLSAAPDRGVYGLPSEQKEAILLAIEELEKLDDFHDDENGSGEKRTVSDRLPALAGRWRVLFSTVTITGSRRVKLGLKSAVALGDLIQTIDPSTSTATSEVAFELRFLGSGGAKGGSLRLEARFAPSGTEHPRRVDISLVSAALTPPALDALLRQHMALLLSVFNPEGWLETTFADGELRVGRDDKGRVFVLERVESE